MSPLVRCSKVAGLSLAGEPGVLRMVLGGGVWVYVKTCYMAAIYPQVELVAPCVQHRVTACECPKVRRDSHPQS